MLADAIPTSRHSTFFWFPHQFFINLEMSDIRKKIAGVFLIVIWKSAIKFHVSPQGQVEEYDYCRRRGM
jgi:hypothetical protein